jgi:hypothetical protein
LENLNRKIKREKSFENMTLRLRRDDDAF